DRFDSGDRSEAQAGGAAPLCRLVALVRALRRVAPLAPESAPERWADRRFLASGKDRENPAVRVEKLDALHERAALAGRGGRAAYLDGRNALPWHARSGLHLRVEQLDDRCQPGRDRDGLTHGREGDDPVKIVRDQLDDHLAGDA